MEFEQEASGVGLGGVGVEAYLGVEIVPHCSESHKPPPERLHKSPWIAGVQLCGHGAPDRQAAEMENVADAFSVNFLQLC